MITVNHILGNININVDLKKKYEDMIKNNRCEKVVINRLESQKLRMRKNTDNKTDVIFMFEHTPHLRNGDVVFLDAKKMFSSFNKFIDIKTDTMIFEPDEGSDIHEH